MFPWLNKKIKAFCLIDCDSNYIYSKYIKISEENSVYTAKLVNQEKEIYGIPLTTCYKIDITKS